MLPRRHLFCGLIALVAFGGCKTKVGRTSPAPVAGIGFNHASASGEPGSRPAAFQPPLHADSKNPPPATVPASVSSPRPSEGVQVGGSPPAIPPPASAIALALALALKSERPVAAISKTSDPALISPTGKADAPASGVEMVPVVANDTSSSPPENPAQAASVYTTLAPVALPPARPVAKLTLASSPLSAPAPQSTPRPISLRALAAGTPPTSGVSAVIATPSLAAVSPVQTKGQPLDLLSRLASAPASSDSQNQPQALKLPSSLAASRPSIGRFGQTVFLPLPETLPVTLQPIDTLVAPIPGLSERIPPVTPPRPMDPAGSREESKILHQKVYQFLLGQP